MERAIIGIDGNCGFALLGENLQEGEAEFVEIQCTEPKWTTAYSIAAQRAITQALRNLRKRLAPKEFGYALHPSHPRYC